MVEFETVDEMEGWVGRSLGVSEWVTVDAAMIIGFAEVTGDRQWIHVDVERAARELPEGKIIAHGCLTLSLMAGMSSSIYRIRRMSRGLNYGYDRVRFLAPVLAGARVRARQDLEKFEVLPGGGRLGLACTMEIEGTEKPAMVANQVLLMFR